MLKRFVLFLIQLYQTTLSPDHGWFKKLYPYGYCKFQPTCSCYTHKAISRFGLVKGGWLGAKRIFRCNPWSRPGIDLVPEN